MRLNASPPASVIRRVFNLYWASLSAGSVSLVIALLYASPDRQTNYGPYAWLIPLAIFVLCFLWVVGSEAKFYWQRRGYRIRVSVKASFNLTINNDAGDTWVEVYREVTNAGKVPIKNLPPLGIGAGASNTSQGLQLKVEPPEGKSFKALSQYTHPDGRYTMHVWMHQVPEGLEPGEKIIYTYETLVPGIEADAFTPAGGSIAIELPVEYDEIECKVTAPAGYKFKLLGDGIVVKDELNNINQAETKQVRKRYPPEIPRQQVERVLIWRIPNPLFRHEYECRYRLIQN